MIRVQFNNSKGFVDADFSTINEETVQLIGEKVKANESGFKAYRLNGDFLGDYSDYTICEKIENGCRFMKG